MTANAVAPGPGDGQPVTDPALLQFVALLRDYTGNAVPAARHPFLAEAAARRVEATGSSGLAAYARALARGQLAGEWPHLVALVTVKESYFFRAPQQFRALGQQVLPALLARRAGARRLRVWSAGCARGEEPASLAMVLAEQRALAGWDWRILATDLDEEALDGARAGLYGERAVAQVPPELAAKYLRRKGRFHELAPELLARIDYRSLNLAPAPYPLPEAPFDLVLLRNVLIYFRRPLQRRVVAEVQRHLAPHGVLVLGATETLWQIDDGLAPVDLGECFVYRHGGDGRGEVKKEKTSGREKRVGGAVEARAGGVGGPQAKRPSPLGLAAERVGEGRLAEAERLAGEAIAADPADPAAHALLGFLHDLAGRADEAAAAYRAALYLDPALYQVRVLLADCFLRLGMKERAERQFREVLASLDGGRGRALDSLAALPLPDRDRAAGRSRQVLRGAG